MTERDAEAQRISGLPWAKPLPFGRCTAVRERRGKSSHFGRCELAKDHAGDHALERGFDIPRWSTDYTT